MKTKNLVFISLFAALLCVAAPISVPAGGTFISPAGGFILSYIPCALTVAVLSKNAVKVLDFIFAMSCAALVCYLIGTLWFMIFTGAKFLDAALMCILPFIVGDIIKIISGAIVSYKLKPFLKDLNKEL